MDYDIAVFMESDRAPFMATIEEFQNIIRDNFEIDMSQMNATIGKSLNGSLQFSLDGFSLDIVPATNMLPLDCPQENMAEIQCRSLLKYIENADNPTKCAKVNSSGLTEASIKFAQSQSHFVLQVARLAKYWNSTLLYNEYLAGRSYVIELLGIAAGQEVERYKPQMPPPSLYQALIAFLKSVEKISSLHVIFESPYYTVSDIPNGIISQNPLVLDPSNPRNNLLHGFKQKALEYFSEAATLTIDKLECTQDNWMKSTMLAYPLLKEGFLPRCVSFNSNADIPKPTSWLITTEKESGLNQPFLIVRKAELKNKHIFPRILKSLSAYLHAVVIEGQYSRALSLDRFIRQEATKYVERVFGIMKDGWTRHKKSHDQLDVTFMIPIIREETTIPYDVYISGIWETSEEQKANLRNRFGGFPYCSPKQSRGVEPKPDV